MVKLSNIVNKGDVVKISILLIISIGCWIWVYSEYKKPIIPPEWVTPLEIVEE